MPETLSSQVIQRLERWCQVSLRAVWATHTSDGAQCFQTPLRRQGGLRSRPPSVAGGSETSSLENSDDKRHETKKTSAQLQGFSSVGGASRILTPHTESGWIPLSAAA